MIRYDTHTSRALSSDFITLSFVRVYNAVVYRDVCQIKGRENACVSVWPWVGGWKVENA